MIRFRRYRVHLVFAAITLLAFIHFSGIREWGSTSTVAPPPPPSTPATAPDDNNNNAGVSEPNIPPSDSGTEPKEPEVNEGEKVLENPHGFAPEVSTAVKSEPSPAPFGNADNTDKPTDQSNDEAPAESPASRPPKPIAVDEDDFRPVGVGRLDVEDDIPREPVRWQKQAEHFPVALLDMIPLPTEKPRSDIPKIQAEFPAETVMQKKDREKKLGVIRESFLHAWTGYKNHALGHDEVDPVHGETKNPFMGWGATLVDALDTLWIMGLKDEFEEAVEATKKIDFGTSARKDIPVFETVIRYLGGLVGAYDISDAKYPALLDKAKELAEILMGAFDTPNRMPDLYYHWVPAFASQPHRAGTRTVLAEIGSLSVEFTRLAQITGENKYYDAVARITNALEEFQNKTKLPGLWPTNLDASGCKKVNALTNQGKDVSGRRKKTPPSKRDTSDMSYKDRMLVDKEPANYDAMSDPSYKEKPKPVEAELKLKDKPDQPSNYDCVEQGLASPPMSTADEFTLGAPSDSTYEYLPKQYMLLGGVDNRYRTMYEKAMDTAREYLLFRPMLPDNRDVRFLAKTASKRPPNDKSDLLRMKYEGSHLSCYAGAMFGMGAKLFGLEEDLDIAKKLTDGCVWAYESTTTGIMPESFEVLPCQSMESCEWNQTRYYDALDPFEENRKAALDYWEKGKATLKKDPLRSSTKNNNNNNTNTQNTFPEPRIPQKMANEMEGAKQGLEVRDLPEDDEPSKTTRVIHDDDEEDEEEDEEEARDKLGPKPTFVTHEEYAEKRIKEERIPSGMTEFSPRYLLRPEAIESVWYMHRITGDDSWREKGWRMFSAVAKTTRTDLANSAISDVTSEVPVFLGQMESFWLGETLKYFYLLFSEPHIISLDDYIVNTEAHPLKRPIAV